MAPPSGAAGALPAGVWSPLPSVPGEPADQTVSMPVSRPVGVHGRLLHLPGYAHELTQRADNRHLLERIAERDGSPPVVIASDDLLDRPEDTTRAYCAAVGIPFLAEALSWEEGERPEVGWYGEGTGPWHDDLRASTGISRPTTEHPPIDDDPRLVEMLERSTPYYEALLAHRVVVG